MTLKPTYSTILNDQAFLYDPKHKCRQFLKDLIVGVLEVSIVETNTGFTITGQDHRIAWYYTRGYQYAIDRSI